MCSKWANSAVTNMCKSAAARYIVLRDETNIFFSAERSFQKLSLYTFQKLHFFRFSEQFENSIVSSVYHFCVSNWFLRLFSQEEDFPSLFFLQLFHSFRRLLSPNLCLTTHLRPTLNKETRREFRPSSRLAAHSGHIWAVPTYYVHT